MKTNYHTHTTRCGHAEGTDREYVEAAISAGIKKLGFSEHVPMNCDSRHLEWFRLQIPETENYFNSIRSLKEEYKNDIEIFIGFEAEYFPMRFKNAVKPLIELGCDYLILGQHFIEKKPGEFFNPRDAFEGTETLDSYVDTLIEGMETGAFSFVAHPDIVSKCYGSSNLRKAYKRICDAAKRLSLPLEYNRLGYSTGRDYPHDLFFEIAAENGNDIVIGYDAHSPNHLLDHEGYEHCLSTLKSLNANILYDVKLIKPHV